MARTRLSAFLDNFGLAIANSTRGINGDSIGEGVLTRCVGSGDRGSACRLLKCGRRDNDATSGCSAGRVASVANISCASVGDGTRGLRVSRCRVGPTGAGFLRSTVGCGVSGRRRGVRGCAILAMCNFLHSSRNGYLTARRDNYATILSGLNNRNFAVASMGVSLDKVGACNAIPRVITAPAFAMRSTGWGRETGGHPLFSGKMFFVARVLSFSLNGGDCRLNGGNPAVRLIAGSMGLPTHLARTFAGVRGRVPRVRGRCKVDSVSVGSVNDISANSVRGSIRFVGGTSRCMGRRVGCVFNCGISPIMFKGVSSFAISQGANRCLFRGLVGAFIPMVGRRCNADLGRLGDHVRGFASGGKVRPTLEGWCRLQIASLVRY